MLTDRQERERDQASFEPEYAKARRDDLRELDSRQRALLATVREHAKWCIARGYADLTTISGRILSKEEATTLACDCVEDTLLTMLDAPTQRALREME